MHCQERDGLAPYQYSQFCALYNAWRSKVDLVMRQGVLHNAHLVELHGASMRKKKGLKDQQD